MGSKPWLARTARPRLRCPIPPRTWLPRSFCSRRITGRGRFLSSSSSLFILLKKTQLHKVVSYGKRSKIDYIRTREGFEVDFCARDPAGRVTLIQVCADVSEADDYAREVRALTAAAAEYPDARPLLLTFETLPPRPPLGAPLRWQPAIAWLLGDE